VVYISCGPETLARDLAGFGKLGYEARGAYLFDLFCHTTHVESIILMTKCGLGAKK